MVIGPLAWHEIEAAAALWRAPRAPLLGRLHWHARTPYAMVLAGVGHGQVLACGAALLHGASARITLLGGRTWAARAAMGQGLVEALTDAGCASLVVHAAAADLRFWQSLGFVPGVPLLRYAGGRFVEPVDERIVALEPRHRLGVQHLDRRASGEERGTWLHEHAFLGRAHEERGVVQGFGLVLAGEGLIVANDPAIGLELQRWHFPVQGHVLLFEGSAAHAHLSGRGYRATAIGTRMWRGPALPHRPELFFAEPFGTVRMR